LYKEGLQLDEGEEFIVKNTSDCSRHYLSSSFCEKSQLVKLMIKMKKKMGTICSLLLLIKKDGKNKTVSRTFQKR
jgi:hypothetical protein